MSHTSNIFVRGKEHSKNYYKAAICLFKFADKFKYRFLYNKNCRSYGQQETVAISVVLKL